MVAPNSRDSLKQYCLRELGFPVIDINVDDDQLEDRIDEALQYWQEFHYDAVDKTYIPYPLTQTDITNKWVPITDAAIRVTNVFPIGSGSSTASGNIFNVEYQMRLSDMYFNTQAGGLTNYVMTKTYLELMDQVLNGRIASRYSRHSDKLYIDWNWTTATVGTFVIIEAYVILDPQTYTEVYNDMMLKQLTTAMFKRQWGANIKKYGGVQLPGGVTLNGKETFDEAVADIVDIKQQIRDQFEEPPRFFTY